MWQMLGTLLVFGIVFYLLYIYGYMKRVMKFKENKGYHFTLDSELQKGELEVQILDSLKQPIAILNHIHADAVVDADKKGRYYLVFTFKSASGNYELRWE